MELQADSARFKTHSDLKEPIFSMAGARWDWLLVGLDGEMRVLSLSQTEAPAGK